MRVRPTVGLFWATTAVYVAIGLYLSVGHGYLMGDSLSRVAAARSVMFSRDPHLAAIGFIFTPLTAIAQLPTVFLGQWWVSLTSWGVTGTLMSAPFMAGAVVQMYKIGRDRGVPPWLVWTVTLVFALNPMMLFYGANGMSEAPFLFCACWAARRLIRWCSTDDVHDLVGAGLALGLGYLARYDALAAAGFVTLFVLGVGLFRHGRSGIRGTWRQALLDAVLVALPSALAFLGWAFTSWLITGQALQQFSSTYGNASILEQSGGGAVDPLDAFGYSLAEIFVMGPALPVLLPVVLILALQRRDLEVAASTLLFGSLLLFATYTFVAGQTFPFLRFYFSALPLMALAVYQLAPPRGQLHARRPGPYLHDRPPTRPIRPPIAALAATSMVVSAGVTGVLMLDPQLSVQQFALRAVVFPDRPGPDETAAHARRIVASFQTEREIADYIDSLNLPRGSVLMDTVYGFAVFTATERPDTFVIPSDEDFTGILNRPAENGVRYILAVPNTGRGESDAVNRRFPTLYDDGGDVATLELEIPNTGDNQPTWRLYRVY